MIWSRGYMRAEHYHDETVAEARAMVKELGNKIREIGSCQDEGKLRRVELMTKELESLFREDREIIQAWRSDFLERVKARNLSREGAREKTAEDVTTEDKTGTAGLTRHMGKLGDWMITRVALSMLMGVEATLEAGGSQIRAGETDTGMTDMRDRTEMDIGMTDMRGRIEMDTVVAGMREEIETETDEMTRADGMTAGDSRGRSVTIRGGGTTEEIDVMSRAGDKTMGTTGMTHEADMSKEDPEETAAMIRAAGMREGDMARHRIGIQSPLTPEQRGVRPQGAQTTDHPLPGTLASTAIDEGLVVLDDRKYVKWVDDPGDISMFPSMKENVEARRVKLSKGKEPVRSLSIKITFEGDMTTTPIRVTATKSARGSTSRKTDTDYVMAEKDEQRIDEEEVILSPRKRRVKKFLMKSSLDEIDTVEPLRRALRQPMQCFILEYLASSKPARDELQMITRKTRIPLSEDAQMAPKADVPTVAVSEVTARADRMATVLLDGMEGVPPDKFYMLGSGTVETILNEGAVLDVVIDNGSEAVIIDEDLAERVGLRLDRSYLFEIEAADGRKQQITGVCHKAAIEVQGVRVTLPVFAVKNCSYDLLLGRTWLSHVHVVTIGRPDGSQTLSIKKLDGAWIMIETVEPRDPRNRASLAVGARPSDRIKSLPISSRAVRFREKKYGPLLIEEEGRIVEVEDLGSRLIVDDNSYPKEADEEFGGVIAMVAVLKEFIPDKVEVFLDDFPIKGPVEKDETEVVPEVRKFVEQHLTDIGAMLEQLDDANLTVSGTKSRWAVSTIKILGFICDSKGRRADPAKLDKLLNWSSPLHSATEVHQFLGVVGYWRIFIRRYAEKVEPLRVLLRKTEKLYWDSSQELAMQELKDEFKEGGRVLGLPFFDDEVGRPFIVSTDAGPCSVGGLLSQKDAEGKEKPLRFESRTLNTAECNYSQFKKEVLAVLRCLDTFRHYIYGRRFILRVDSTAVASVLQKDFSLTDSTIARWLIQIRLYDYKVERISGTKNAVADELSRIPLEVERPIVAGALTMAEPRRADRFMVNLYEGKYRTIGLYLSREESQDSDIRRQAAQYCLRAGHLFRRPVGSGMPFRVVCDPEEGQTIVVELHDGVVGGHRGVKGTYKKVRRLYWWEG
ncbi:hypothetical protein CBR_g50014 [Chara braunii]|uniref:RNA-directed DNA polymerase n=1 Tax=Chara braunii TaxID=69332 RepID=A0A388K5K1_CHABU|nr:hypothetical protein CBR_g50014 [Chara braunii]|eukprot:GBG65223.1 hypothetical protein CBR_g50014 [Chara braunii]